jgi:S-adenosylmethionine:tRNA ribosyltransferase-isomerase
LTPSDFDYVLPAELIAQHPPDERGASRLLIVGDTLQNATFANIVDCLRPGDLLVFNDTKVIKARLHGRKTSGGAVEIMVERVLDEHRALAMIRASHAPKPGAVLHFSAGLQAEVLGREGMLYTLRFSRSTGTGETLLDWLAAYGELPLPPYITHDPTAADEQRYQTVFARTPGAVAAPTAGLHFTDALLTALTARGVAQASLTLHVGAGTFQPVKVDDIAEHVMHSERFSIPAATIQAIAATREAGGRVVAVGTTSLRALESWAVGKQGETDIFIRPGFEFKIVDALITNFHLPKSTLLMLVSAFAGTDRIRAAYRHAVAARYRFFSYGDAMWLERATVSAGAMLMS